MAWAAAPRSGASAAPPALVGRPPVAAASGPQSGRPTEKGGASWAGGLAAAAAATAAGVAAGVRARRSWPGPAPQRGGAPVLRRARGGQAAGSLDMDGALERFCGVLTMKLRQLPEEQRTLEKAKNILRSSMGYVPVEVSTQQAEAFLRAVLGKLPDIVDSTLSTEPSPSPRSLASTASTFTAPGASTTASRASPSKTSQVEPLGSKALSSSPWSRDPTNPVLATMGTTVVRTREEAQEVLKVLEELRGPERYHAIDTEVRGWEPALSPYGHGEIICFSIYCGDDVNFGSGPRLWVDNLNEDGTLRDLVECFREYLEDEGIQKVLHNYSFDRAMFLNAGVHVRGFAGDTMHMARLWHSDLNGYSLELLGEQLLGRVWRKTGFKELMDAEKAATVEGLHLSKNAKTREAWMDYSTFDAVATFKLHQDLMRRLSKTPWPHGGDAATMMDLYRSRWLRLGEVLVAMEERGVPVDLAHLQRQETRVREDVETAETAFKEWVAKEYARCYPGNTGLDVSKINCGSGMQLRHLIFGKGIRTVVTTEIGGLGLDESLATGQTPLGLISMSEELYERLAGKTPSSGPEGCGMALAHFGQAGCEGLWQLTQMATCRKALTAFLDPLQQHVDKNGRVHTSFGLRTRTGRLSSSSPNLQQLPALDKDRYEVRKAVVCPPGYRFIVADYGQLDLRVLAHLSECPRMISALSSSVDIHSGTAYYMYEHVRQAVDNGDVALDDSSDKPTVKDTFSTERRHAKTVNFGIAYGLTARGLSEQMGCTFEEASAMIERWFSAYPEVLDWQQRVRQEARTHLSPYVVTLRGRWRRLADLIGSARGKVSAAERQAINSPVQGGSADVVVEAMIKTHNDPVLRELGYNMLLQVHDELIFEGPEEHAQEALERVRNLMEHPFLDDFQLAVPLPVDAKIAKSWHEGKSGGANGTVEADIQDEIAAAADAEPAA